MSLVHSRRGQRLVTAVSAAAAAALCLTALPANVAFAAVTPGTLTVTLPANGKLAAETGKQVVVLTVSGTGAVALSESNVTGVTLGTDPACANLQNYVVTSATTVTVKTPNAGCAAAAAGPVSILFGADDPVTKATGITFVEAPAIDLLANKPVITENSTALAAGQKVQRFVTNGAQNVRVYAANDFAFDPRTAAGLGVAMGGKAGTAVKVYDASGVLLAATAAGVVGNSLSFTTGAGMTAGNNILSITQDGVSKTFLAAETGLSVVAAPTVTSLSVTSGKAGAATTTVITGTKFDTVATHYTDASPTAYVTFCGVAATSFGATAVNAAGTQITVITPTSVGNASPGLGTGNYYGPCKVQVGSDMSDPTTMSPMTAGNVFTFLAE